MSFSNKDGLLIAKKMISVIQENKGLLSEIDGACGDGDHGINMNKGFTLAAEKISPDNTMSDAFLIISQVLLCEIGGSMGPLYGTWFRGLGSATAGAEVIDDAGLENMFSGALAALRELTPAQPGDKTLLDVLLPASETLAATMAAGKGMAAALAMMAQSAKAGFEATRKLQARVGRASRLGERSIGHPDAGAASCMLLLTAFAETAISLIEGGSDHATVY